MVIAWPWPGVHMVPAAVHCRCLRHRSPSRSLPLFFSAFPVIARYRVPVARHRCPGHRLLSQLRSPFTGTSLVSRHGPCRCSPSLPPLLFTNVVSITVPVAIRCCRPHCCFPLLSLSPIAVMLCNTHTPIPVHPPMLPCCEHLPVPVRPPAPPCCKHAPVSARPPLLPCCKHAYLPARLASPPCCTRAPVPARPPPLPCCWHAPIPPDRLRYPEYTP